MQRLLWTAVGLSVIAGGCDFDSQLAPRVYLPVVVDASGVITTENDLGYEVEPARCRAALQTIEFTTQGEQHASLSRRFWDRVEPWVISTAHAHPGHDAGGEVVGELRGRHVFDWRADGMELGEAELLQAHYDGANFGFARAKASDRLEPDDPLVGHTFDIAGVARRGDRSWTFEVQIDQDEDRRIIGLPLDLDVHEGSGEILALRLSLLDPVEGDTVWDGIDFALLDDDGDGHVVLLPDSEAYNRLRRNLQAHDHFSMEVR